MIFLTDGKRHLICVPYSKENLHTAAKQLNIKKCWYHRDHYDIPKKRIQEIESKCVRVTTKTIVEIIKQKGL